LSQSYERIALLFNGDDPDGLAPKPAKPKAKKKAAT
jgi:hypothetical protein